MSGLLIMYSMLDRLTEHEKRALDDGLEAIKKGLPKLKRSNEQLERWIEECDRRVKG